MKNHLLILLVTLSSSIIGCGESKLDVAYRNNVELRDRLDASRLEIEKLNARVNADRLEIEKLNARANADSLEIEKLRLETELFKKQQIVATIEKTPVPPRIVDEKSFSVKKNVGMSLSADTQSTICSEAKELARSWARSYVSGRKEYRWEVKECSCGNTDVGYPAETSSCSVDVVIIKDS